MSFDYARAYKQIKRYVTFDYGRRTRFNPGEKAAIRKAYNAYTRARRSGGIVKVVRRNPGESQRAYKRRLSAIKRSLGQDGSPLKGVVLVGLSPHDKVQIKRDKVVVRNMKTDRRSRYYAIDPLELVMWPETVLANIYQEALDDGFDTIAYMHGLHRGFQEFVLAYDDDGRADYGVFLNETMEMLGKYPESHWKQILTAIVAFRGGATKVLR